MTEHKNLDEALVAFQAEMPTLPKDSTNPHFKSKFTSLDTIVERVTPVLTRHGLSWSTLPTIHEGQPALRYRLAHAGGDALEDTMPLLLDRENSQGLGSALTYARRYAVCAVLNLVADEDDDGNAKSATPQDVDAMVAAAAGLHPAQIMAIVASCGLQDVSSYNQVPHDAVGKVTAALKNAERTA